MNDENNLSDEDLRLLMLDACIKSMQKYREDGDITKWNTYSRLVYEIWTALDGEESEETK